MASKKKIRRNVVKGIAHIKATFNNTLVTITDLKVSHRGESRTGDDVPSEVLIADLTPLHLLVLVVSPC